MRKVNFVPFASFAVEIYLHRVIVSCDGATAYAKSTLPPLTD